MEKSINSIQTIMANVNLHSSFPVIHNVANIDIFVHLLMDIKLAIDSQ